jgi:hypothetical protein
MVAVLLDPATNQKPNEQQDHSRNNTPIGRIEHLTHHTSHERLGLHLFGLAEDDLFGGSWCDWLVRCDGCHRLTWRSWGDCFGRGNWLSDDWFSGHALQDLVFESLERLTDELFGCAIDEALADAGQHTTDLGLATVLEVGFAALEWLELDKSNAVYDAVRAFAGGD